MSGTQPRDAGSAPGPGRFGQAASKARGLRGQASVKAGELKTKAARAGRTREDEVSQPTRQKMFLGAQVVRDNRDLLLAAAGVAVASWLVGRRGKG